MTPGRRHAFPLHDRVNEWIWQTVAREGANIHMGFDLPRVLEQAGLNVQRVRAVAEIGVKRDNSMWMPMCHPSRTQPQLANRGGDK